MILILTNTAVHAESLCASIGFMGYLAVSAEESEIESILDRRFRACIIPDPESLASPEDAVRRIAEINSEMPIFALLDTPSYAPYTRILPRGVTAAELIRSILAYADEYDVPRIGDYRLMGLDLAPVHNNTTYFFEDVSFTHTESQIIRLLISSYPAECPAEAIIRSVFRASRRPEASSIRTHISSLNKKFRAKFGRNLVVAVPNVGYKLITPETSDIIDPSPVT